MTGTSFRIGIVGTGRIAARMIAAMRHVPGLTPGPVVSQDRGRAANFAATHGLPGTEENVASLLSGGKIDAVYIGNDTAFHARDAGLALRARVPVLCEKPFATQFADARHVLDTAAATGTLFMEGLWTLCLPAFAAARQAVTTGRIGTPHHLFADFSYPHSPESHHRLYERDGGGCLLDRTVYPVSLAVFLFGPANSVQAVIDRTAQGIDQASALTLTHGNGVIAQLNASMIAKGANLASISGSAGRLDLLEPLLGTERLLISPHTASSNLKPAEKGGFIARLKASATARRLRATLPVLRADAHPYGADQYAPMLAHFHHLLATGARESPVITHALSLEVARIIGEAGRA